MPCSFRILRDRGIAVVRYEGHATVAEGGRAFGEYAAHPDARPGQSQLVDLSAVISFERDFAQLMAFQARKAEQFLTGAEPALVVYFAPTRLTYDMAALIRRSWEGIDGIAVRVLQDEAECLDLLWQPERSIDELLTRADIA